ncbi:aminotransferase class I/II-fold pyridoxal phosphate-dependent enzyme [Bradyrhizobium sp. CCBAU 53421]|uniref:aminotransferase class I/II-fold pyridoxal phosphate-dependent enzyme n=1 Tax=Bradyrhizobium sp. CCBAU 53421 TaxID=1325120 RepID=UPI00188A86F0|nr:aminotransferase class I/II-fold pyridoxal phosphate-dependent enzyme [Bradyrhizobium sp. CCBAU 53421]QOZ36388.1 7-keto-8-aminopelargonate synthetase [Bradyrhizobium sp. CCBAU 53421]
MGRQSAGSDDDRPSGHFRNTAYVINKSRSYFDAAHSAGLMAVQGRSTIGRTFALGIGPLDGRPEVVDFVRCSYLGLDNHPAIVAAAIEAIEAHGSLHWSCARTRLNFDLLAELEATMSEMFGARVLAFSTVMLANLGAMPILASGLLTDGVKPVVVFDRIAHVSLAYHKPVVADETRVETIAHNDIDALERLCREHQLVAYVCDGVYSMGGNAPIKELRDLQERFGLFLYIDDAHGISLFGRRGEGFARTQFPGTLGDRTIIAASLAKGFGASGGMLMLGTAEQEALFRRFAIPYAFSVGPNLAAVGAAIGSCKIHRSAELAERQMRLTQRIEVFDRRVQTPEKANSLPIRMVAMGSEAKAIELARELLDAGFYTSVIFFPTVAQGKAGVRVCITADHEVRDIERLCDYILERVPRAIVDSKEAPEPSAQ